MWPSRFLEMLYLNSNTDKVFFSRKREEMVNVTYGMAVSKANNLLWMIIQDLRVGSEDISYIDGPENGYW